MTDAALGIRPHTGWAVTVAISGEPTILLDRRRVALVDGSVPRQAYHAAAGIGAERGRRLVATATETVDRQTREALTDLIGELRANGRVVTSVGIAGEPHTAN